MCCPSYGNILTKFLLFSKKKIRALTGMACTMPEPVPGKVGVFPRTQGTFVAINTI